MAIDLVRIDLVTPSRRDGQTYWRCIDEGYFTLLLYFLLVQQGLGWLSIITGLTFFCTFLWPGVHKVKKQISLVSQAVPASSFCVMCMTSGRHESGREGGLCLIVVTHKA